MIKRKSLIVFLCIAFGVAWVLFLAPLAVGKPGTAEYRNATLICWAAAMWAPGLAAILTTLLVDRQKFRMLNLQRLGDKKTYLWAWLLPPALVILTGILTLGVGAGKLDLGFSLIQESMANAGSQAIAPVMVVGLQVLMALTLGPLINTLFALGEELGWRGYLLPQLLPLGQGRAILFSGMIWGLWHLPAVAQGFNYPGHPVLGVFLMIVFCALLGTILSWLYLRTRSPWAPALGHGSVNAVAGLPILFLAAPVNIMLGGTIASVLGWVPMAMFIGWLIWTKQLPVKIPEETEIQEAPAVEAVQAS
jgi:uncharacterized protein